MFAKIFFQELWLLLNSNIIGAFFGALFGFFGAAVLERSRDRSERRALINRVMPLVKVELRSNLHAIEKLAQHLPGEMNDTIALLPQVFSTGSVGVAAQGRFVEVMEPTDAAEILGLFHDLTSANETYHQLREHSLGMASALAGSIETRKVLVQLLKAQLRNIEQRGTSMLIVLERKYPDRVRKQAQKDELE